MALEIPSMNRRLIAVLSGSLPTRRLVTGAVLLALAPVGLRAAVIDKNIQIDQAATRVQVAPYIKKSLTDLMSDDGKLSANARADLVNNCGNPAQVSGAFLSSYAQELSNQINAMQANPAVKNNDRLRLNLAIVTAKVAEKTQDASLINPVVAQIGDNNEGVVIWGLRGARFVIPPGLNVGPAQNTMAKPVITAVLKAAKQFDKSGEVIAGAYDALNPDDTSGLKLDLIASTLIPPIQELLDWRIAQYSKGVPTEPSADQVGINYLITRAHWAAQKQDAQTHTLQIISKLLAATQTAFPNVKPEDHDLLIRMLQDLGKDLQALGWNDNDFKQALSPLVNLKLTSSATDVSTAATAAIAAFKAKWPNPVGTAPATTATTPAMSKKAP